MVSPTVTTIYTVTGSNFSGCSNSAVITQSVNNCTSLASLAHLKNPTLLVYPNPSSDRVIISSDREVKLILVNALGMTLKTLELDVSNNFSQEINSLNSGIYFLISNENYLKHKIVFSE